MGLSGLKEFCFLCAPRAASERLFEGGNNPVQTPSFQHSFAEEEIGQLLESNLKELG
jgi:hypothetical protein